MKGLLFYSVQQGTKAAGVTCQQEILTLNLILT